MNARRHQCRLLSAVAVLVFVALPPARAQVTYTVTDLGANFVPFDINNSGQIVGQDPNVDQGQAFLLSNGTLTHLGNLSVPNQNHSSTARAINDSGVITGEADFYVVTDPVLPFGAHPHAFFYDGTLHDLGNLAPAADGLISQGASINNAGVIAGSSNSIGNSSAHAVVFSGGSITDLGTIGGTGTISSALGINNSGVVVGWSNSAAYLNTSHAFIYSGSVMQDIGTLPNQTGSSATAINDSGVVAGVSGDIFRYENGSMTDLGFFGGNENATAINASGQVVGYGGAGVNTHPFSYTTGGTLTDLNTEIAGNSGWVLQFAWGLNDAGQIVGTGDLNGAQHGFLLTPTAIPEPSLCAGLFGAAALGFAALRCRNFFPVFFKP